MLTSLSAGSTPLGIISGVKLRAEWARNRLKPFSRHESGSIAIEFAVLAPLFIAGIVLIGLGGIVISDKITLDQIVRAGAVVAVNDPGMAAVDTRMIEIARAKGFSNLNSSPGNAPGVLRLSSTRSCFCPENLNINVGCGQVCQFERPNIVRYEVFAGYRRPMLNTLQQALIDLHPFMGSFVAFPTASVRVTVR